MSGLRVLVTNNTLAVRAGSELYVRDLATALLARGHTPIAYSAVLGEVAEELRRATIPVVDDLTNLAAPPDVIHGQHHLETMAALLHFPGVPAIYVCHGWLPWEEAPPRFPRIRRYVAVDEACRDRLACEHGIPEERVRVLPNFVDLGRFRPRPPLPPRPERALVFGPHASGEGPVEAIRAGCARLGVEVDVVGLREGNATPRPECLLPSYDVVFARGRSALEALATGAAVVVTGQSRLGPMVAAADLPRLRALNFGIRALDVPLTADAVAREVARYDPADATEASRRIRAGAGRDAAVDDLVALYREVLAAEPAPREGDADEERAAAARYLPWLGRLLKGRYQHLSGLAEGAAADLARVGAALETLRGAHAALGAERDRLCAERDAAAGERDALRAEREHLARDLAEAAATRDRLRERYGVLAATATVRLRERLLASSLVGPPLRGLARLAKGRLYQ